MSLKSLQSIGRLPGVWDRHLQVEAFVTVLLLDMLSLIITPAHFEGVHGFLPFFVPKHNTHLKNNQQNTLKTLTFAFNSATSSRFAQVGKRLVNSFGS